NLSIGRPGKSTILPAIPSTLAELDESSIRSVISTAMGRPRLAERSPYDRDRVVDVAVKVFTERGYDGTSMADIATALGVHNSSIYHHVASKEQLLEDAVKRALNALHWVLAEPGATGGTAVERLRYVVERTVEI